MFVVNSSLAYNLDKGGGWVSNKSQRKVEKDRESICGLTGIYSPWKHYGWRHYHSSPIPPAQFKPCMKLQFTLHIVSLWKWASAQGWSLQSHFTPMNANFAAFLYVNWACFHTELFPPLWLLNHINWFWSTPCSSYLSLVVGNIARWLA